MIQTSDNVENARLDAIEAVIGASPKLRIYTGTKPTNCAAEATGTLLCEMALPADWMNSAASRLKTKLGSWSGVGLTAAGAGTSAGYFRLVGNAGTACGMQGTVTGAGGGGDMTLDNVSIAANQAVTVNTFTLGGNNA